MILIAIKLSKLEKFHIFRMDLMSKKTFVDLRSITENSLIAVSDFHSKVRFSESPISDLAF